VLYFVSFTANFHSSLVARSWKPNKSHVENPVQRMHYQIVREKHVVDSAASNSEIHVYLAMWLSIHFIHTGRPVTGGRQNHTIATPPDSYNEGPGRMLSWGRQNICRHLWHTAKIYLSKICWRVKLWSVVLRPERNPHWVSSSFDSIISRHFFKALAYTFPGRKMREMPWWLMHSFLSPFLCTGMIIPV